MDTYKIPKNLKCGFCGEVATAENSTPIYECGKSEMLSNTIYVEKIVPDRKYVEKIEIASVELFPERYNQNYRDFKKKYIEWCFTTGCFCKCKKHRKTKVILEWFTEMLYMDFIVINKYLAFSIADDERLQATKSKYKKLSKEHLDFVRQYHELIIAMKYRFFYTE